MKLALLARSKRLRSAALTLLPLVTAAGLSAQTIWIDGIGTLFDDDMDPLTPDVPDHNGSGNWDDILKWDTGMVPSGVGIIVNFKNAYTDSNIQPRIRSDQEPHLTDGQITVGILNFEDTAADGNDTNFAYEGETDFIMLGNGGGSTLYFDNGLTPSLDGPAAVINYTLSYRNWDVVRFGRDDTLAIDGINGLLINTAGTIILDGDNFIEGLIVVRAVDSGPLSDLGDGTNANATGPDGIADGDGGGDGQIQVEANFAFGASGVGNETIFMGDGGTDQFGDANRLEPSLRFNIDDAGAASFDIITDPNLDGSRNGDGGLLTGYAIEETLIFRYFPAGDGVGAGRIWQDCILVNDDVPVVINGDIHLERGVDWDGFAIGEDALSQSGAIEEGNVRWEFQCGDTATSQNAARGAWDTNNESLTFNGDFIINDQSLATTENSRQENQVEFNPVNAGSTITVNGVIGENAAAARDADAGDLNNRLGWQGIFKNGDGTLSLNGDNEFDGNIILLRGTLRIAHVGAIDDVWNLNIGGGGTNAAHDELRFMVGAEGTFLLGDSAQTGDNNHRNIALHDLAGNSADPDQLAPSALPYIIGMDVPGVAELDFDQLNYSGDGFNENANNMNAQLDSLPVTIELTAVAGAQLTFDGRIQGQELNTATFPLPTDSASLGTVTLNKTGDGTIIIDENRAGQMHQYSGPTNVLAGSLILNDESEKTTAVNVSPGATLGGEGNVGDATDVDGFADRATDGIDNDNDGLADALDPEMNETGWYQTNDGDPTTGDGNTLFGGANANVAVRDRRHRPKVSTAVTFEAGSRFDPGSRDAADLSTIGQFEVEGSVTCNGAELRFDLDVLGTNDVLNVVDDQLAGAPAGAVAFSGADTFVFTDAGGLADGTYVIITTANGVTGTLPTVDVAGSSAGFDFVVAQNGNNVEVTVTATGVVDSDGDGIPAEVEAANGLSDSDGSDAASDLDGDGFTALFEYAMGTLTAAGDSGSPVWQIDYLSDVEVNITYGPITSGVTYNLTASADGQVFTQIDSFTAGADAPTNTFTDTSGNLDVELYRLEIPLPLP
ncbi:MAG: autotransporter-associated beta strand repeat-containing protein [Roseibacillus sp.]|jgi:autotransporter-associated beta strand protein